METKTNNQKTAKTSAVEGVQAFTAKDLGYTSENRCVASPESFAVAIRALMQNWRQGTVGCKGRSDVARSGKKPWKQKGTGRARAGTARSPIWRGGGVTFGPQKRVKTLKVTQKAKKALFNTLVWDRLENKRMLVLDWSPSQDMPKTALAYKALKGAGLTDKKITLFVSPSDQATLLSFGNLPNVQMLLFDQPNVYALAHGDYWVVLKQDSDSFKEMVSAWI